MSSLYKSLGGLSANKPSQVANPLRGGEVFIGQVLQLIKDNTLDEEGNNITAQYPTTTGLIRFNRLGDPAKPENQIKLIAQPLDRGHYRLPLLGEQILLTKHLGKYYYFTVVSSTLNMISNINPSLLLDEYQSSSDPTILVDVEAQNKRFESRLDLTTALFESKNHLPTKVREGDTILEGRLGGVIKLTQTITKDDVWNKETQITNIGLSDDGHPMLVLKAVAKTKTSDDIDLTGLEDEDINNENSSVYLTTTQNMPLEVASSKKMHSWNVIIKDNSVGRGVDDSFTTAQALGNLDSYDPSDKLEINLEGTLGLAGLSTEDGGLIDNVQSGFVEVTKLVIAKLEGGYWHPAMYLNGRLQPDNYYGNSGETMMGIDRYAGGNLKDTTAGKQFWGLIDKAIPPVGTPWIRPGKEYKSIDLSTLSGAAQNAKWGWKGNPSGASGPGGELEVTLTNLAATMMEVVYSRNKKAYFDKETAAIVDSDNGLLFNFSYACWNGSGWFQKFAKDLNAAVKQGITDPLELRKVAIASRVSEGLTKGSAPNALIQKGGKKIASIIGVSIS